MKTTLSRQRTQQAKAALALTLALALTSLFATPAQAAPETIAEFGQDAGQVSWPLGAAVNRSTGDLYITEGNNFRVSKFDAAGNFLLAFGYGVADGVTHQLQTCGPEASPPTTHCFDPNFYPLGLFARSVAVDNTAGPSHGDVYVSEQYRVSKFTSSGQLIFMVGRNVNKTKKAEAGATQAEKDFCSAASGDTCGSGESGTLPNEFSGEGMPLAVDSAGVVWVGARERLTSFSPSGVPGSELALAGAGDTHSLALDSAGDFYVKSDSTAGIRKLEAGTGTLLETLDAGGEAWPVTLDEEGNVYIGDTTSPYRFKVYDPAGNQIFQFGAGQVIGEPGFASDGVFGTNGIAVGDAAGRLYAASSDSSEAPSVVQAFPLPKPGPLVEDQGFEDVEPTTATLTATINPENQQTTYRFQYGTSESYGESTSPETLSAEEFEAEDVAVGLEELIPGTTYHFRALVENECEPVANPGRICTAAGPDQSFTTLPAVGIDAQWATDLTATSAILNAELDPLGVAASWWIEYGTGPAYGRSTAESPLPASFGDIAVAIPFVNLTPGTTYHYRFVARDERDGNVYVVQGADKTFTTQVSALGFSLADARAWEMVSPPQKFGALIKAPESAQGGHLQAAADGNALAYLSAGSIEAAPQGSRAPEDVSELARRDGAGGWHSKDITPPHTGVTSFAVGNGLEYKLFSSNLEQGLLEPRDTTLLSPEASERTPYLRQNTEPATYTPLVTGKEGFANVPPGTEFGGDPADFLGDVRLAGATSDLRYIVFKGLVPLAAGAATFSLYEWEAGQLREVSVLPASEGGSTIGAELGSGSGSLRKAISDDGSRVFWSTPGDNQAGAGSRTALYVRDMEREESVRLDVVQPGALGKGDANPVFQGANSAGTVAFFTDSQQLTEAANKKGRDLYRCDVTLESGELGCDLVDLTTQTAGAKENAEVQGLASGMGDDATHIYFVAKGVLDSQPNGIGDSAVSGQPNLYLWRQGSGTRFIATLSGEDEHDWGSPPLLLAPEMTAAASPSGRYLAFMSQRSLTGHDNRDAKTGALDQEVFRYDADTDELICASCNPSGASPVGLVGQSRTMSDPLDVWSGRDVAAILPEATKMSVVGASLYRPRAVHDNGRLFFNAADALVPSDSNGNWDVYQYEPTGTGDCSSSSGGASISRSAGGCVSLISSGTGEEEAAFLDASVGGNDVFFFTPAQLSVTDEDHEVDVYDARVDGIPATLTPNAECLGEACQAPARAPDDPTPASASFKGAGNVAPVARCPRGKRKVSRKGKSRCVSHKRQHKHKHKRQSAKRAAHSKRGAKR